MPTIAGAWSAFSAPSLFSMSPSDDRAPAVAASAAPEAGHGLSGVQEEGDAAFEETQRAPLGGAASDEDAGDGFASTQNKL